MHSSKAGKIRRLYRYGFRFEAIAAECGVTTNDVVLLLLRRGVIRGVDNIEARVKLGR